jgi:2-succinyl-5-enolpyruvyl-6-hydroxy-3-cyclohexene-1-carboxylate synthase
VGALLHQLPEKAVLHLANSNSVRLAQMFPFAADIQVCCNRGTSGIDGSLSTAVGFAAASKKQTFLLIGDLSFFYDMNGLWNRHIGTNLHILLNNNGGGEIFHLLPGLNQSEKLDGYIAAGHQTEAKAWAEQQGFLYLAVTNMKELNRQLPLFVSEMDRPVLMEVFSDIDQNTEVIRSYYHQQKNKSKAYGNKSMEND